MDERDLEYVREISEWLVGRLSRTRSRGGIRPHAVEGLWPRARSWWILEGRSYPGLSGSLACNWELINSEIRALLRVYSPVWRTVDAAEGEVDWLASAQASSSSHRQVFVSKASRAGLSESERAALEGWRAWVSDLWADYVEELGPPAGVAPRLPWPSAPLAEHFDDRTLKRWAHTARRSRWPLLRNIVAGSLRTTFELEDLDVLPLPSDHAALFELVCIVRILKRIVGSSGQIRWLDNFETENKIQLPGVTCEYQKSLPAQEVLRTVEFDHGLRSAIKRHTVSLPQRIDALITFDSPRNGIAGILVEAKSGSQDFRDTLLQLKCYRAALAERGVGRLIVWGIVEEQPAGEATPRENEENGWRESNEDLWVFSTAAEIPAVIEAVGIIELDGRRKEEGSIL